MSSKVKFEEKLISCVEKRDELYNMRSPNYKNAPLKSKTWSDIGIELGKDWSNECKQTWDSLRSQFVAYLRKLKNPTGSGAKSKPYFRQSEAMKFLKDHVEPRKTESNFDMDLETDSQLSSNSSLPLSLHDTTNEDEDFWNAEPSIAPTTTKVLDSVRGKRKMRNETPFEAKLLKGLDSLNSTEENEDEHVKFLLSLAPAFRRLAGNQKKIALVRMNFQQILFNAEFQ